MPLNKRIDHLHIIRGVAALLVVLWHARFILWCGGVEFGHAHHNIVEKVLAYSMMFLFSSGSPMVICFFVLSGFFLKISYENNTVAKFYANRIIRIYVPYIANTIISCAIFFACFSYINPDLQHPPGPSREITTVPLIAFKEMNLHTFLKSLVFLPNREYIAWNNQYWSLLYEGIFYLTIPILMFKKLPVLFISIVAFAIGAFYTPQNPILLYFFKYLVFFQIGICLHYILDDERTAKVFSKLRLPLIWGLIFVLYLVLCFCELSKFLHLANLLGGIVAVSAILALYHQPDVLLKSKAYKALKKLGDISFSLYLSHYIFLYLIYAVFTRLTGIYVIYMPVYIVVVPFVIIVSNVFYLLIEKQSIKFKNRSFTLNNKNTH